MIRIYLSAEDLAETRFAFSPIWELGMSLLKAFRDPAKHALNLPWVQEARRAIEGRDLELLLAVTQTKGYMPDFLTPPPLTPFPEFDDELERVAQTPHPLVRRELEIVERQDGGLSQAAQRLFDEPDVWLPQLIDQMREYWKLTIEPHWPRIRALLEGDVMYRARQLALGGAEALFADLHPSVTWRDGVLEIDKVSEREMRPNGAGLLLIPAVFDWPGVAVLHGSDYLPTFSYSPRGIVNLWEPETPERQGAMDELIGGTRADILRTLQVPMTTSEIAKRLHLTAAAVSQQLGLLRRAGVVQAHRQGRGVYSKLTTQGKALLDLLG